MPNQTLELLTYRLHPGISAQTYLGLVDQTLPALHGQPGLLQRSLAHDEADGIWTEVVLWQSQSHADAAGRAIMADPTVAPLMRAIDMSSLTMQFQPLLWHKSG